MFQPPPFTKERLDVILRALTRHGGEMTCRNLNRLCGVHWWEIEQATDAGFIEVEIRKPKTGRPSQVARKVNKSHPTKLPPSKSTLEPIISYRHWNFAFNYVMGECGPGLFDFRRRAWKAYQKTYRSCKSQAAARAGASRLLKKAHIRSAIAWTFARYCDPETNCEGVHPKTTSEIWKTLHRLRNHRAQWIPDWLQHEWDMEDAKQSP